MLDKIRTNNNKILKDHFEEFLGKGFEIEWGFPIVNFSIKNENENYRSIVNVSFSLLSDAYNISTEAEKRDEGGNWVSAALQIEGEVIDFVKERVKLVSPQFFTTAKFGEDNSAEKNEEDGEDGEDLVKDEIEAEDVLENEIEAEDLEE